MKVTIQTVAFNASEDLLAFIQKKMDKLDNYHDKIIASDVYLKTENTSAKENKVAEIIVHIPGEDVMVKKQCKTFEEAVDSCVQSAERMLLKKKAKKNVHL